MKRAKVVKRYILLVIKQINSGDIMDSMVPTVYNTVFCIFKSH